MKWHSEDLERENRELAGVLGGFARCFEDAKGMFAGGGGGGV